MDHLQVFSHLYFGTNIFHGTFLKNVCRFGNFITACLQKTQNKSGHSPSTRENILIFHQNPLQHPISALSASHVIIYCVFIYLCFKFTIHFVKLSVIFSKHHVYHCIYIFKNLYNYDTPIAYILRTSQNTCDILICQHI